MIRNFPRDREAKKRAIEALLVKHHVDISRLWRFQTQTPDPEVGIPFTGPLSPVPFVFPPTETFGTGGTPGTTQGCCDSVDVIVDGVANHSGSGVTNCAALFNGRHRLPLSNASFPTYCQYVLVRVGADQPGSGGTIGGGPYIVATLGRMGDDAEVRLHYAADSAVYRAATQSVGGPTTLTKFSETKVACASFPATVQLINNCGIIESGTNANNCLECAATYTFTAPDFGNPYNGCNGTSLSGPWTLIQTMPGVCAWESNPASGTADSSLYWSMYYMGGSMYRLTGYDFSCGSSPVVVATSISPCDEPMTFTTEDTLFDITLFPV